MKRNAPFHSLPDHRDFAASCFVAGVVAAIGFALFVIWFVVSQVL